MISLALMLLLSGDSVNASDSIASDWKCATPLIAKNFAQRFDARQLALRISDECARPFRSDNAHDTSDLGRTLKQSEEMTYLLQRQTFMFQIESEIYRLRREKTIPLVR